jgi:large subunit ribosomal protein L18
MDKKTARLRRAKKTRIKMREISQVRLCIHRTPKHMYAQVISGDGAKVIASASTLETVIKDECSYTGNVSSSVIVGKYIAQRAQENGVKVVAFDRSGFRYHGRVKALADSARENGLEF